MFKKFVYMDETVGDTGGGAAPVVAAPAPSPTSILAGAAPAPNEFIPEKFRVMNGDALDVEASAKKLAESYAGLEKRVGSGDLPPKTAEEYAVTIPDEFKDAMDAERLTTFKTEALAQGISQKQFDFMMGKYFAIAPELVGGAAAANMDAAKADLQKTWPNETEFNANVTSAYKAFAAFADPADAGKMDEIGNNPMVLRMLAKIGKEMGEAGGIPNDANVTAGEDVQSLMRTPAYFDAKHPDHKATNAKVQAYYAKKHGTAAIAF